MKHSSEAVVDGTSSPAATGGTGTELRRALTHRQMIMLGLGSALGTGLFLGSGAAIGVAGPAVIVSYVIGAILAGIVAACLGEMTARFPLRGAFGALCAKFLSPFAGYVARWAYAAAAIVAVGGEVVASATYLRYWWPELPMGAGIAMMSLIIIAINLFSVRSFGFVEFFLSGIKVTALSLFILIAALLVVFGLPSVPATGLGALTSDGGFFPFGVSAVWQVMAIVMFSFVGLEIVSISAAEAMDPGRAIKTAMRTLIWRLAFFYVVAISLVLAIIPWRTAAAAEGVEASPFVTVFSEAGIPAAAAVTNFIVLVAAMSAANANLYGSTRLINSLAVDGLAPRILRRTNRRGVPAWAVLVSAMGTAAAAVLAVSGVADVFVLLVSLAISGVLIVWLLILAAYIRYRLRFRDASGAPSGVSADRGGGREFQLIGGAPTAAVGFAGILAVAATAFVVPSMALAALVGLCFLAVIGGLYWALKLGRREVQA
jgi:amino acid transporter, AAT family